MSITHKNIKVGYGEVSPVIIGTSQPLAFIGGPCAIESYDHTFLMADLISKICKKTIFLGYSNLVMTKILVHLPRVFVVSD